MSLATFHPKKLAVFAALSLADLVLTYQLLQQNGGIYESNPIANAWLVSYGWAGLVVFKLIAITVLVSVAGVLSLRQPRLAGEVITFACVAVGGVVIYSCTLMNWLPSAPEMVTRRQGNELALQTSPAPVSRELLKTRINGKRLTRRRIDPDAGLPTMQKASLASQGSQKTNSSAASNLGVQWRTLLLLICNPSAAKHDSARNTVLAEAKPAGRPAVPTVPVSLTSN
jgi:hypothetical protein